MAVTYSTAAKNAKLQAVISLIDAQSAPGRLEFYNGSTTLAAETLSKPSATVTSGVATFSQFPVTCTVTATGTAVSARIVDGNGTVILDGLTVATSGANVNLNTTSLVANQNLTINSFSITGQ